MVITKLVYSFGLILFGLLAGYAIQRLPDRVIDRFPLSIEDLRRRLQRTALLFVNPVAILGAVWIMRIDDPGGSFLSCHYYPSVDLRPGHRPGQLLLVDHHLPPGGRSAGSALRDSLILANGGGQEAPRLDPGRRGPRGFREISCRCTAASPAIIALTNRPGVRMVRPENPE